MTLIFWTNDSKNRSDKLLNLRNLQFFIVYETQLHNQPEKLDEFKLAQQTHGFALS